MPLYSLLPRLIVLLNILCRFVDTFVSTRFRTKVVFLSFINCSKQLDCLDEIKFKRLLKGY